MADYSTLERIKNKDHNSFFLEWGYCAETRAFDAYERLSKIFRWNRSKCMDFAPNQLLCADDATPEGFGVYMLVHNNLCESYNEIFSWYTYIKGETIEEIWFIPNRASSEELAARVIFAKTPLGYVFQGVYKFYNAEIKIIKGKERLVKTYKRISTTYPMKKSNDFVPIVTKSPSLKISAPPKRVDLMCVEDKCKIQAYILENKKGTIVKVDISLRPFQKELLGKKVGDIFSLPNVALKYRIDKIYYEE
jgi:hypothetical protein